MREARRQRTLPELPVPAMCLLDPDGDIVRYVKNSGSARRHEGWACYHTEMWVVDVDGLEIGVVGMAVGASFAVLVAEQLAVSGARITISVTSGGRISESLELPCFVLIDRALRDEGTSAHYQPPAKWSRLAESLRRPSSAPLRACVSRSSLAIRGQLMRRSAKPPRRSRPQRPRGCFALRWRRRPSMRTPALADVMSFAWRTSRTRWRSPAMTSRRASTTAATTPWLLHTQQRQPCSGPPDPWYGVALGYSPRSLRRVRVASWVGGTRRSISCSTTPEISSTGCLRLTPRRLRGLARSWSTSGPRASARVTACLPARSSSSAMCSSGG